MSEAPEKRAPASCGDLFRVFTRLALQGFGGVLPVAQHTLVERERWLTRADFVELLAIGQVLPGPNIVNLSLMLGDRFFGWRGALASLAGLLLVPMIVVLTLAALYSQFAAVPQVAAALRGMGAASAGLVIATALKLMSALKTNPMGRAFCALYAAATLAAVGLLHWPLVVVLAAVGPLAVATAWWQLRRSLR